MTERERLIELIKNGFFTKPVYEALCTNKRKASEYLADYLLENGTIVLPVKAGDTVYINGKPVEVSFIHIKRNIIFYIQVDCFWEDCENCCFSDSNVCDGNCFEFEFTVSDIGKTVFLTREEAEKALAERGETT